jgi:coenzyme F420-0:L-glutamate ligase/coenzyme F420-1:gamma-L-glutamate ligase
MPPDKSQPVSPSPKKVEMFGLSLPEVAKGDDLGSMLVESCNAIGVRLNEGDVFVVASKVISKSAGYLVSVEGVEPSGRARRIAKVCGGDPRVTQIVLDHSDRLIMAIPIGELERNEVTHLAEFSEDRMAAGAAIAKTPALLVVERSGQIYTDAGLDFSNHPEGSGSLPPIDPNLAAKELREAIRTISGITVAVILSDTEVCLSGGSIDLARGSSGLRVIDHGLGRIDRFGRPKFGGIDNLAQEMAGAAALLMGQGAEGIPAVLIRGISYTPDEADGIRSWIAKPGDLRRLLTLIFLSTIRSIGIPGFLRSLFARR